MAWKKIEGGNKISLNKQTVGTEWVGQYSKRYEVDSAMSKTGKQTIWVLLNEEGVPMEFYGCASLDGKMSGVPLEAIVKIKLAGKYMTKFGKEAANVEVEYDDDK